MKKQGKMIKTGLFPGSFNPVHIGHLIIAHHVLQYTDLEEIWFVISPQNPLKDQTELLPEAVRLELLKTAIEGQAGFILCQRELTLDRPSYTSKTIEVLKAEHIQRNFVLIIGSDNLAIFDQWKDYKKILAGTDIYVYPRKDQPKSVFYECARVTAIDAPLIEVSSSFIRASFKSGKDPRYLLPEGVYQKIVKNNLLG